VLIEIIKAVAQNRITSSPDAPANLILRTSCMGVLMPMTLLRISRASTWSFMNGIGI
jgi:hypothetical protein